MSRFSVGLAVDLVVLAKDQVLLIRRAGSPFRGRWALPGGFVEPGERLAAAARRECLEETGVRPRSLVPAGAYGEPGRDPRGRVVSFVYRCDLGRPALARAGSDAAQAAWMPVGQALRQRLAFDHDKILADVIGAGPRRGASARPSPRGTASPRSRSTARRWR